VRTVSGTQFRLSNWKRFSPKTWILPQEHSAIAIRIPPKLAGTALGCKYEWPRKSQPGKCKLEGFLRTNAGANRSVGTGASRD